MTVLVDRILRKLITGVPLRVGLPAYGQAPVNPRMCVTRATAGGYPPVLRSVHDIGALAQGGESLDAVAHVLQRLEPDAYVMFLLDFYAEHRTRIRPGEYADLTTALWAIAELAAPRSYLEIGVRRGRSLSVVASLRPEIDVVGIDLWLPDYAGMSNPGEEFVRAELAKIGHRGRLDLITGNSHLILPRYLSQHPDQFFDLIVVDGDHTRRGASLDLRNVLPRLAIGGLVVFDDIVHPSHPYLGAVWNRYVGASPRFAVWEYRDTGFGVGIGLRKF